MKQQDTYDTKEEGARKAKTFRGMIWERFRMKPAALWSYRLVLLLVVIALLADLLANDQPVYCKVDGQTHWPIFETYYHQLTGAPLDPFLFSADWKKEEYEAVLFPLITYSPKTPDLYNDHCTGPFEKQRLESRRFRHWLGTDQLGKDVASGLIHGTRISLLVGFGSMLLATFIGVFLGALAGFLGDRGTGISRAKILMGSIGLIAGIFYGFIVRSYELGEGNINGRLGMPFLVSMSWFFLLFGLALLLSYPIERIPFFGKKVHVPVDILVIRFIEVVNSIPALFLILSIAAIFRSSSIFHLILVIGLIAWTGIARFVRAEFIRIREQEYIQAARVMGFSNWRIIWRHVLPNALGPVLITVAFGIAAAILAEATLSFLGIGVPVDQVSWGKLLNSGRETTTAWWLALFPGLAIFLTVTAFNLIGDGLTQALDPRSEQ
jgi:peptide/nickel transport system permease protein